MIMFYILAYILIGLAYSMCYVNSDRWVTMNFYAQESIDKLIKENPKVVKTEEDYQQMLTFVLDLAIVILVFGWLPYFIKDLVKGFK